ncbi:MAG: MBL fold metallo-hydrolase [Deinococcales bacterium]
MKTFQHSFARYTVWQVLTGQLQENAYLVKHVSNQALLVDPGDDAGVLLTFIAQQQAQVQAILLTHAHFDHIGAVQACREALGVKVYLHQDAFDSYSRAYIAPARYGLAFTQPEPADIACTVGRHQIGNLEFEALLTPGHAPGHLAFYFKDGFVLSGDSLFAGSIGRTDIPGADQKLLLERIRTQLYTLPDDTVLLPGHGRGSTIGREKSSNPFVKG